MIVDSSAVVAMMRAEPGWQRLRDTVVEAETLSKPLAARYAGWDGVLGTAILEGRESLAPLEARVASGEIDPSPVSGGQERLENAVNRVLWTADRGAGVGSARR